MNGGSVFVNPSQGAYFSGGSGSGGAIRLVGRSIKNFGYLEAKGGNSSGGDPREIGARFLSNAGGAGGGGRVALISDNEIINGFINVNGGNGNGDGYGGFAGSIFTGPKTIQPASELKLDSGTLIFDTGGSWTHSSGSRGKGILTRSFFDVAGERFGYGICTFAFLDFELGKNLTVLVKGNNALQIVVDGNVSIATDLSLDGKSGSSGIFSGLPGPGGWSSGRGLRNTDGFSNFHPALNGQGPGGGKGYEIGKSNGGGSYGGLGSGGLNGGLPGSIYGDNQITLLVGGSGGGHSFSGSGNSGGGGGAIGFDISGNFILEENATISVRGGNGFVHNDASGAAGSGVLFE